MIAADTNVLIRIIVSDDLTQRQAAVALLEKHGPGGTHVNAVVLTEISWVLGSVHKFSPRAIRGVMLDLLAQIELNIGSRAEVMQALSLFEFSKADFSDCLIAALNKAAGAVETYTFDQRAAMLHNFRLVGSEEGTP